MTGMSASHTFLPDLVSETDIPTGGTLSRVVFKDDLIRVVLFAFDEGQELTEHTASVPAVLQVLSGRLRLEMGSETFDAAPGDWAHMPAGLPHAVEALEPSVMLLTLLPAKLDELFPTSVSKRRKASGEKTEADETDQVDPATDG